MFILCAHDPESAACVSACSSPNKTSAMPKKENGMSFSHDALLASFTGQKADASKLLKTWTLAVLTGSGLECRGSTRTRTGCMPRIYDDTISSCSNILPHLPTLCCRKMYPSPFQFPYVLLIAGVLRQCCVPSAGALKKECFPIATIFLFTRRKGDSFKALVITSCNYLLPQLWVQWHWAKEGPCQTFCWANLVAHFAINILLSVSPLHLLLQTLDSSRFTLRLLDLLLRLKSAPQSPSNRAFPSRESWFCLLLLHSLLMWCCLQSKFWIFSVYFMVHGA